MNDQRSPITSSAPGSPHSAISRMSSCNRPIAILSGARIAHIAALRQTHRILSCNPQLALLGGELQPIFQCRRLAAKGPAMLRPFPVVLLAALAAAPAAASDDGPYYRAELAQPAVKSHVIAGGVLWMCEGTACFAGKGTARPEVMCKRLAQETSPVVRFSFAGTELGADDLALCNG
jgi:hypothetical protein